MRAGRVDGLAHLNPYLDDPITEGPADSLLPVVMCGPTPPIPLPQNHWVVSVDDVAGVRQALDHLGARGARAIAMIGGDPRGVSARIRVRTHQEWLGATFDPDLVEPGDYGSESGPVARQVLPERRPDIDAVFCASDRMTAGALETARRRGRRVPQDLRVMGFDDHELAARTDPRCRPSASPSVTSDEPQSAPCWWPWQVAPRPTGCSRPN